MLPSPSLLVDPVLAKMLPAAYRVNHRQLEGLKGVYTWMSCFMSSDKFDATADAVEA